MAVLIIKRWRGATYEVVADTMPIDGPTGDNALLPIPASLTARGYRVMGFFAYNRTVTPIAAQIELRNGAGGTGQAIVAATVLTALDTAAKIFSGTIADGNKQTSDTLFVRLTVANVAASTISCQVLLQGL